jgi:oxygen-independent coproporphyrinogen III oxidase
MIASLAEELELQRDYLAGERVSTIYFGGGTPSILTRKEIELLLKTVCTIFPVDPGAEITMEANPDDLSLEKLKGLNAVGINRLSVGIQSFHNNVLKFLNRAHNVAAAEQCVHAAREAGFKNISIDLIYAIPGQTHDAWLENIRAAINLHPEHISSYSLTIEDKTVFGRWAATGKFQPVEDEFSAQQLEILVDQLEQAGYEQYEVSNFSKPGFASRHNSSYWKEEKYLGVGPSAHSYDLTTRQFNVGNNHLYIRSLKEGKIPFEKEVLSLENHANEFLLTRLRTAWGIDLENMKQRFQYDVVATHEKFIDELRKKQFAVIENGFLKLTKAGKLFADKISSELFLVS